MVFVKTKRNRNKFRYNFRLFLFWYPVSHSSTRVYDFRGRGTTAVRFAELEGPWGSAASMARSEDEN